MAEADETAGLDDDPDDIAATASETNTDEMPRVVDHASRKMPRANAGN